MMSILNDTIRCWNDHGYGQGKYSLEPFRTIVTSVEDCFVVAGAIPLLARNTHTLRPTRKGFDCLATNALVLAIAHQLHTGNVLNIPYGRKPAEMFTFFDNDGNFKDSGYKNYLCFEALPFNSGVVAFNDLSLGDATVQQRWGKRGGEPVMFGHIRTLIFKGPDYTLWCNGTTAGPTTLVICRHTSLIDMDKTWLEFPNAVMNESTLLLRNTTNVRNKSFFSGLSKVVL